MSSSRSTADLNSSLRRNWLGYNCEHSPSREEVPLKSLVACLSPLFLLLLDLTIWPQRLPQSLPSSPPASASPVPIIPPTVAGTRNHSDPAQLRRQAQQLLQL